jgi:16S rRNA (uracil1498-N3)-methyltransferase
MNFGLTERFLVLPEDIGKEYLYLKDSEAHHIKDVLRYKIDDPILAFDGQGRIFEGRVNQVGAKEIKVKIIRSEYRKKSPCFLHLAQAIPKKQKMDFIVEKATELGTDDIMPMITERTVPRPAQEKEHIFIRRWQKIALEAAKQSRQVFLPKIREIRSFSQILAVIPEESTALIPWTGDASIMLEDLDWDKFKAEIFVFIGPEGDFSQKEISQAREKGIIPISLGKNILKSETAAIYMLSILDYRLKGRR